MFMVPDSQLNAKWLSERDRALAVERIRSNHQSIGNKTFKWYQVKDALTDPITWALALVAITSNIPNGGFTNFFSQLILGLGFTAEESLLLGIPGGVVEVVSLLFFGYISVRRKGNKIFISTCCTWFSVLGCILLVALPKRMKAGRLVGYYLTMTLPVLFACMLSMISSNVAGYTKKTFIAAVYLMTYCAGNIIGTSHSASPIPSPNTNEFLLMFLSLGPQTFRPKDAPTYLPAEIVMLVSLVVNIFAAYFIWWWYARQNKIKEQLRSAPDYVKQEGHE